MFSTRGDRVPWRLFKTLPGPASFVLIAPFKCQAKVPSLLANCTTCTLHRVLCCLHTTWEGSCQSDFLPELVSYFFLFLVQFPPNNAIISNGQWKIRAHTERRGSPPPQRSNTANVIYVMHLHIVPTSGGSHHPTQLSNHQQAQYPFHWQFQSELKIEFSCQTGRELIFHYIVEDEAEWSLVN